MADVDQCTRYAEAGLCGRAGYYARKIAALDDKHRNIIFRGKESRQIKQLLLSYTARIKEIVSTKFGFECKALEASSDNNRDGADLYCAECQTGKKVIIEVKFGSYTDKAAGMKSFERIFGTSVFSEALSSEQRHKWHMLVEAECPDLSRQLERTISVLNEAAKQFNAIMAKNHHVLPKDCQKFLEGYLLNNSGSYECRTENYIRFEVTKNGHDINDVMLIQKGYGTWRVEDIQLISPDDEKARITVFVHNDETGVQIKFVLNNKNDLHLKGSAIKIPSKYMLNTPSWNVWVKKRSRD